MEIDGHPTQDLVDELVRRGAMRADGTNSGPKTEALRFIAESGAEMGFWLYVPAEAFQTGLDEIPGGR